MAVKNRSILKEWSGFSLSHRVRGPQAANKIKSIFRGGVYVAKYSLRGAECRSPDACVGARRGAQRNPSMKKGKALFMEAYSIVPPPSTSSPS